MKKTLLVVIPLLLLLGGAGVLAFLGIINIPGLTPHKRGKATTKGSVAAQVPVTPNKTQHTSPLPTPEIAPPKPATIAPKPNEQKMDRDQGAQKLAELWNGVDTKKLIGLLKDWKDPEVARVFAQMDADKVAELLGQMNPKRASKISIAVEKEASLIKDES